MKIIIKTKNLELTDDFRNFIEKKIGSIKKYIDILKKDIPEKGKTLAEVFVEVEKETKHHKKGKIFLVKTQIVLPGKSLIAWSRADDLFEAVVGVKDELKIEIEKYKFKNIDRQRRQQKKFSERIDV
jgi:ribosomal subunit interface protein